MNPVLSVSAALDFVEQHGLVLASARGPAARLIDAIAGEAISGNWWSHPRANAIYNVLAEVSECQQILVCRLVNGKITLVHRRLWPALVCLAQRFAPQQLAQVKEQHTASGRHVSLDVPFPEWVPPEVAQQAQALGEPEAAVLLEPWLSAPAGPARRVRRQ